MGAIKRVSGLICARFRGNQFPFQVFGRDSHLFEKSARCSNTMVNTETSLTAGLDQTQVDLLQEPCILVNERDEKIGSATKKVCHQLENISKGMLHRAFSVFLFNSAGDLLLQQRSNEKITFPAHFTNTCCSHPLNFDPELEEVDAIGVKRAAQRKLQHELGIPPHQVPLDAFHYLTRIHYKSDNVPYDGLWGEHEIDYILIIQRDVTIDHNSNEVLSYKYVNRQQLQQLIESSYLPQPNGILITPWFKLVVDNFLSKWWDNLDNLKVLEDHAKVHKMC